MNLNHHRLTMEINLKAEKNINKYMFTEQIVTYRWRYSTRYFF